jgi:serpin B
VEADNQFGFELFRKVDTWETEADNLMVSPMSVSLALAMTYNGAAGETKSAMEKTLKLNGLTPEEINQSYQSLINALKTIDPKVMLEIAQSIFFRNGFEVEENFISLNTKYYDAGVSQLDFNSPLALETINNWVAKKTHDKIKTILDEITPEQMMFLLNAVYFKGSWAKEFNPESTQSLPFYKADGTIKNIATMCRLDKAEYLSNDLFKAVRLPYGQGDYNLVVFLPQAGKSTSQLISRLDPENWESWLNDFQEVEKVDIRLPKFKFPYEIKLNDILTGMGMGIAFGNEANFTGINRVGGLRIGFVKHKTFIDVNEEGTEAAAVTVVSIEKNSVDPGIVPFYVDRPFVFAITENKTGAILFLGKVTNPEYN